MKILKDYYYLMKPGIVYGNAIPAAAAFAFGARGQFDAYVFFPMLMGLMLTIAGACVANNVIDKDIDANMKRTKDRAVAAGRIRVPAALIFCAILTIAGLSTLLWYTNVIAALCALLIFIVYVAIYSPAKHRTMFATHVGTLVGALPPIVGYAAATGIVDMAALILFLIMGFWQMAHFLAIAIYRKDEYKAAGVPVMSVQKGIPYTRTELFFWIIGFLMATQLLTYYHFASHVFAGIMLATSAAWIALSIESFFAMDVVKSAKRMFFFSLIALILFSLSLVIETLL